MSFLLMLLLQAGAASGAPASANPEAPPKDGEVYWGLLEKDRHAVDPKDPNFVAGPRPKEFRPVNRSVAAVGFDRMDKNRDGVVDANEIKFEFRARNRPSSMPASVFARKERQHMAMLMGTYDKDKSGSISKDEMQAFEIRRAKAAPKLKGKKLSAS